MSRRRELLSPLAVALVLLDPDDRPGGRAPNDGVRDRAYARMWLFSAGTMVLVITAVAVLSAFGGDDRRLGVALTAVAMLPACTFAVMAATAWNRAAFARRSRSYRFLRCASVAGWTVAFSVAVGWEVLDPVG